MQYITKISKLNDNSIKFLGRVLSLKNLIKKKNKKIDDYYNQILSTLLIYLSNNLNEYPELNLILKRYKISKKLVCNLEWYFSTFKELEELTIFQPLLSNEFMPLNKILPEDLISWVIETTTISENDFNFQLLTDIIDKVRRKSTTQKNNVNLYKQKIKYLKKLK